MIHRMASRPESPLGLLLVGVLTSAIGWAMFLLGEGPLPFIGLPLACLGSLLAFIGSVGTGVQMGVRRARWLDCS